MPRSDFLTNWTGKDIGANPAQLTPQTRQAYVDRLRDVIRDGLWMTSPNEQLISTAGEFPVKVDLKFHMVCFTELRLSGARPHFSRYGLLGFVVRRSFVLSRGGGPVLYVRQHDGEPLVGNLAQMLHWISARRDEGVDGAEEMIHAGFFLCSFMKGMSTPNSEDFAFIDENEWRIVQTDQQVREGRIARTGQAQPTFRIPIAVSDLQMLVVPDSDVRATILFDTEFTEWCRGTSIPILTPSEIEEL